MSIRRDPIYLSNDVWRALWLLARSRSSEGKLVTADEMVDEVLRKFLESQFPQLLEHQKQVGKLEKELIASLSKMQEKLPRIQGNQND